MCKMSVEDGERFSHSFVWLLRHHRPLHNMRKQRHDRRLRSSCESNFLYMSRTFVKRISQLLSSVNLFQLLSSYVSSMVMLFYIAAKFARMTSHDDWTRPFPCHSSNLLL